MASNEEYIKKNKIVLVDDDKNTKLHYAAALGNVEEVDKIIANKQKLDPENYLGWTPLMMAVRNSNFTCVDALLTHGADATKKNKFGMNVFLITVSCGDLDLVDRILFHLLCGGVSRQSLQKIFSPISLAILFKHNHIFKFLLEHSFNPNVATPLTGITPAMFAAAMGNQKAINKLLKYNADLKQKNCLGKTAQDILQSRLQNIDIVKSADKLKTPTVSVVIVSPQDNTPSHLQLTPYPCPSVNGTQQHMRKSSNVITPNFISTPGLTPVTPQIIPQMFFGQDFTPTHFISPTIATPFHSSQILNTTISPSSSFFSPMMSQPLCKSNCV